MTNKAVDLEQAVLDSAAYEIEQYIARDLLWKQMESLGYTRVKLLRFNNNIHAVDISYWLADNCKGFYHQVGSEILFENQQDANWFKLRWL